MYILREFHRKTRLDIYLGSNVIATVTNTHYAYLLRWQIPTFAYKYPLSVFTTVANRWVVSDDRWVVSDRHNIRVHIKLTRKIKY